MSSKGSSVQVIRPDEEKNTDQMFGFMTQDNKYNNNRVSEDWGEKRYQDGL